MTRFLPGHYLAVVDATKSKELAQQYSIRVYPTFKYFENGAFKFDYGGYKTKDNLITFMKDPKSKTEL